MLRIQKREKINPPPRRPPLDALPLPRRCQSRRRRDGWPTGGAALGARPRRLRRETNRVCARPPSF